MNDGMKRPSRMLETCGRLRESWYAAALSTDLKHGQPIGRTLFEWPLVLWRNQDGLPVAMEDRCAHRHAPLSQGRIEQGRLVCPYHGWSYAQQGQCVEAPSQGPQAKPPACKVPSFPCQEKYGLIWVYMGKDEPMGEPFAMPHYEEKGWGGYYMVTPFANDVTHLVENFMDVPHTRFVHAGWFRREQGKPVEVEVERTQNSVLVTYHAPNDAVGFSSRILNPRNEPITHTDRFYMPNTTRVDYGFGSRRGFVITSTCTPRGPHDTLVYTWISYRLGWFNVLARIGLPWYTRQVIQQDVEIMRIHGENLRRFASYPPSNHSHESESEAGGLRFRGTAADLQHAFIESLREHAKLNRPASEAPEPRRERVEFWI